MNASAHRSLRRNARNGQVRPLELGSTKARLYIDCARQSDAGLYTCVAKASSHRRHHRRRHQHRRHHLRGDDCTPALQKHQQNASQLLHFFTSVSYSVRQYFFDFQCYRSTQKTTGASARCISDKHGVELKLCATFRPLRRQHFYRSLRASIDPT